MKRSTKKYLFLPAVALMAMVTVLVVRCKKPTEGIDVIVNTTGLFHYTALVQVVDASGNVPANLSVTATGNNAAAVYGLDGKKALGAPAGIIAIGIHPKMEPTAGAPLTFNLVVSGPNYLKLIVPVTVTVDQKSQIIKASILNLAVATAGVASANTTAAASGGTVTATTTLSTPTSAGNPEATTITIPAGTKLQDASGNVINASSVSVTANNFNTAQQNAVNLFPGGSLVASNISGGTSTSAVLAPAGFVNIEMTAGGTAVKNFSAPINLSMTLDPNFKNPSTGAPIAAGQTIGIYSYNTDTGQWKFESNATVTSSGGNLVVNFTTTHLTTFVGAQAMAVLSSFKLIFNIAALVSNLTGGATLPVTVTAAIQNGPSYAIYNQGFALDSLGTLVLDGKLPVPTTTNPIIFTISYGTQTLGTGTLSGTGASLSITLTNPTTGPEVNLSLMLNCTEVGKNEKVIPPDFYLLYKPTGQAVSNYAILGQVSGGGLTTHTLVPGTFYDFKAVLGSNVKEVINHTVVAGSNSTTVGATNFLGAKAPAQNRIDINSLCSSLP